MLKILRMQTLPSIYKDNIIHSKLLCSDWYLITVICLMPTCFIGFLPSHLLHVPGLFDIRILTFLLALPLVLIGNRASLENFKKIPGIWALLLVGITVVIRILWSIYSGIKLFEIVAVLRWNFIWPIFSLCVLHYVSRLPVGRLHSILRVFLLLFSLQACLLVLSLIIDYDFFLNKNSLEKSLQYTRQGLSADNLRVFPVYIFVGTAYLFVRLFESDKQKRVYLILFSTTLMLPMLLTRRMYMIVLIFQTFLIYFFAVLATKKIQNCVYPAVICICAFSVFFLVSQDRIIRWTDKIVPIFKKGINPSKIGTYAFRERLLEDAILSTDIKGRSLFGMGYRREYTFIRERYSYVLGEDSLVAPVIFCEGWSGLFLRVLPYLLLLLYNFKRFWRTKEVNLKLYSSLVISVIVAQIPAYLQTASICHYEYFYVPLVLFELIILKTNRINSSI